MFKGEGGIRAAQEFGGVGDVSKGQVRWGANLGVFIWGGFSGVFIWGELSGVFIWGSPGPMIRKAL